MNYKHSRFFLIFPFGLYFLFSLSAALFIQFIFLPYLYPSLHLYDGLIDYGDWIYYHNLGIKYAEVIRENGWSSWQLKPKNWGILGFISAIYSFTDIYKPFVLIPFIALINALGGFSLFLILRKIFNSRSISFYATLPFLLVPSSFLWVTQIMKDVFTINAVLMFLCAFLYFYSLATKKIENNLKDIYLNIFLIFFLFISSIFIFYLIRPYLFYVSLVYYFLFLFLTSIYLILKYLNKKLISINLYIFIFINIFFMSTYFITHNIHQTDSQEGNLNNIIFMNEVVNEKIALIIDNNLSDETVEANDSKKKSSIVTNINKKKKVNNKETKLIETSKNNNSNECQEYNPISQNKKLTSEFQSKNKKYKDWQYNSFVPYKIDNLIANLYKKRLYFVLYQSCSNTLIDAEKDLNSTVKIIKYIPKAIILTFFSPFPSDWFKTENVNFSFFYNLLSIEMIFHYIFITSTLLSFILFYKNINYYFIVLSSIYFSSFSVFFFPNIGALVRYRHSGLILLSCFGLAVLLYVYKKKFKFINKSI